MNDKKRLKLGVASVLIAMGKALTDDAGARDFAIGILALLDLASLKGFTREDVSEQIDRIGGNSNGEQNSKQDVS
jgi:hypothetical protein